jgi:DNA-binding IclR family transcriptional regulator
LLALLGKIVRDGFALTENVGDSGVIALGAPVFDASDRLLLAIGCSAPISRTTKAQVAEVRERLLALTAAMTKRMRAPGRTAQA